MGFIVRPAAIAGGALGHGNQLKAGGLPGIRVKTLGHDMAPLQWHAFDAAVDANSISPAHFLVIITQRSSAQSCAGSKLQRSSFLKHASFRASAPEVRFSTRGSDLVTSVERRTNLHINPSPSAGYRIPSCAAWYTVEIVGLKPRLRLRDPSTRPHHGLVSGSADGSIVAPTILAIS